jgi:hypothetical protein
LGDGSQPVTREVVVAAERVDAVAAADALRDRVDREVARREIVLDRAGQWREVDRATVAERDAPGTVPSREGKRGAVRPARERSCGALGLGEYDVDVDDRPSQRVISNRAADDPGFLAAEQLSDQVTNRRPPAWRATDRRLSGTRARS